MEQDELNKESPESALATRWILAVGLGGILAFVCLSYLWFGLTSANSSPGSNFTATLQAAPTVVATTTTAAGTLRSSQSAAVTPTIFLTSPRPLITAFGLPTLPAYSSTPFLIVIPTLSPSITPTPTPTVTPTPADTPTLFATATAYPTVTPTDAPAVALPKAAALAFDGLQSMHFVIEIWAGKVEIAPSTELKRADGDLTRTKRFQARVLAHVFIGDLTIQTIGLDNEQYMTNPIGGKWGKLSPDQSFNLAVLFDNQNGVGGLTRQLQNVRVLADESIDNVGCNHFVGTLPGSAVRAVTLGTLGHNPVTLDIWAGRDDHQIRQVWLKETVSNGAFWAINLSKFNQDFNIQKPL